MLEVRKGKKETNGEMEVFVSSSSRSEEKLLKFPEIKLVIQSSSLWRDEKIFLPFTFHPSSALFRAEGGEEAPPFFLPPSPSSLPPFSLLYTSSSSLSCASLRRCDSHQHALDLLPIFLELNFGWHRPRPTGFSPSRLLPPLVGPPSLPPFASPRHYLRDPNQADFFFFFFYYYFSFSQDSRRRSYSHLDASSVAQTDQRWPPTSFEPSSPLPPTSRPSPFLDYPLSAPVPPPPAPRYLPRIRTSTSSKTPSAAWNFEEENEPEMNVSSLDPPSVQPSFFLKLIPSFNFSSPVHGKTQSLSPPPTLPNRRSHPAQTESSRSLGLHLPSTCPFPLSSSTPKLPPLVEISTFNYTAYSTSSSFLNNSRRCQTSVAVLSIERFPPSSRT